jgi:hypothetical protein
LQKKSKKLLFTAGCGESRAKARRKQKFFGSFFQKRTAVFHVNAAFALQQKPLYRQGAGLQSFPACNGDG